MARFQYYRIKGEPGYFLDCQADVLSHLNTRLMVPLRQPSDAPDPAWRLNPTFEIEGAEHRMVTQFAGALPARVLGNAAGSLRHEQDRIMAALDMLITGI